MINILFELGLLRPLAGLLDALGILVFLIAIILIGCRWIKGRKGFKFDFQIEDWEKKFYKKFLIRYPAWGFIQQLFFMAPVYVLLSHLMPNNTYVPIFTAMFFAMLHFPNFLLMFATGFLVTAFITHLNLHHNIYILGILHGLIATVLEFHLPRELKTKFYIWYGYAKLYK